MTGAAHPDAAGLVGRSIGEIDTPAAFLDLDAFDRNCRRISQFLTDRGRSWRPHTKAHVSPFLAARQIAGGALGVTCATIAEAEAMARGGIRGILIAAELSSPAKWTRAATLPPDAGLMACVDGVTQVEWASAAATAAGAVLPLLIEIDLGMHRCGVRSTADALRLADAIARRPGVELAGVMGYEGHLLSVWPLADKTSRCAEALGLLVDAAEALRRAGHEVAVVSCGGTGTFLATGDLPGPTESQAGGGCLMDGFYAERCHVDLEFALTLSATVMSRTSRDGAVVDAGFKTLGNLPGFEMPRLLGREGIRLTGLSAEHGLLTLDDDTLEVGDRIDIVPAYSDAMLFLHRWLVGHRQGVITDILPLSARGPFR